MTPSFLKKARGSVRLAAMLAAAAAISVGAAQVGAQIPAPGGPGHVRSTAPEVIEVVQLHHMDQMNDLNDAQTALRNVMPWLKIYGMPSRQTIVMRGTQEEIDTAKKLLAEFDRPGVFYRLTYTIGGGDAGAARKISLVVSAYGKQTLKEGKRVPLVTGSTGTGADQTTQVQYVDLGILLEASMMGTRLTTKIEESAASEEKSGLGAQDPVIRQTMFEGSAPLVVGKPIVLGTINVPGSTRAQQISVTAELLAGERE